MISAVAHRTPVSGDVQRKWCAARQLLAAAGTSAAFPKANSSPADPKARSSVVEHYLDTVGVGSSILPAPTPACPWQAGVEVARSSKSPLLSIPLPLPTMALA